jgi:hypothetical protein
MNRMIFLLCVVAAFAVAVGVSIPGVAQEQPGVQVHLAGMVAVPGNVLEPGDYIFQPLDPTTYPNTVKIVDAERDKIVGYYMVEPATRTNFSQSIVELSAPDFTGLRMVKEWYGPGDSDGFQFVYSAKDIRKADQLAQALSRGSGSVAGK